jgi:cation:H+ antiporter
MLLAIGSIILGFALLIWGADRFVFGAAALARNLGVSPLLIGLTIVGFGTSAPELLVSAMASLQGNPGLATGNAIGSNIANIGLIIGTSALVSPLIVKSDALRREFPLLLAASGGVYVLLLDGNLGRADGALMLAALIAILVAIVRIGRQRAASDPLEREFEGEIPSDLSTRAAAAWFGLGLIVLLLSSRMLVWGAVDIATLFGVSDLVIGLTIVAVGTSLPELAASVMSTLKGEDDIAVGNVVGSNIYNLLGVLCLPGLLAPGPVDGQVLSRDFPVMLALTVALLAMSWGNQRDGCINRLEGAILLACFAAYQGWLFIRTQPHLVGA